MNYSEMSDFEINKAVAESLPNTYVVHPGEYPSVSDSAVHVERRAGKFMQIESCGADYCNDASDAWPIIFDNNICIVSPDDSGGDWCAYTWDDEHEMWCDKPLRAAMIVYLMMQEAK